MTDPQNFLLETAAVVEQRANRYEGDYYGTAAMWSSMLGVQFDALDVLRMMICMKIVRTMNDPTHEDSWRDIAGYAALGPQVVQEMVEVAEGIDRDEFAPVEIDEEVEPEAGEPAASSISVSTASSTPPEGAESVDERTKVYRKR